MNKSLMIVLVLFVAVLASLTIGMGRRWLVRAQSKKDTDAFSKRFRPYAQVDEKASAVHGPEETAIRELADAVLLFVVGNNVPNALLGAYKERLVRTEINYRSGQTAGVPEVNVVRVLDELARELNAPEYARTDEVEVRETRLAISGMVPNLIAAQPLNPGEESTTGSFSVRPLMSPLEAVFVTRFLILQKEINEFAQITSEERADLNTRIKQLADAGFKLTAPQRREVMTALIEQHLRPDKPRIGAEELAARAQQRIDPPKGSVTHVLVARIASSRYNEMQEVFRRASTMKVSDAVVLANKSLALLGIEN